MAQGTALRTASVTGQRRSREEIRAARIGSPGGIRGDQLLYRFSALGWETSTLDPAVETADEAAGNREQRFETLDTRRHCAMSKVRMTPAGSEAMAKKPDIVLGGQSRRSPSPTALQVAGSRTRLR